MNKKKIIIKIEIRNEKKRVFILDYKYHALLTKNDEETKENFTQKSEEKTKTHSHKNTHFQNILSCNCKNYSQMDSEFFSNHTHTLTYIYNLYI